MWKLSLRFALKRDCELELKITDVITALSFQSIHKNHGSEFVINLQESFTDGSPLTALLYMIIAAAAPNIHSFTKVTDEVPVDGFQL